MNAKEEIQGAGEALDGDQGEESLEKGGADEREATEFRFTRSAALKILELCASSETPLLGLRVGVRGGGCSGFSYFMEPAALGSERPGRDLRFEQEGAVVLVDKRALKLLRGTELNWKSDLIGAAFEFRNPNAKQTCGCGSSFSV